MVKAIIFDCFGVLTTDTWKGFVNSLPPEIDTEKARDINRQYDAGLLNKQEFLEQIRELTGRKPKQIEDMLDNEVVKNLQLLDYIRELKARGFKIGLLSNIASNWIRDTFLTADEQALFDAMVFSFEVKMVKPDERIFQLACERLAVEPAEAVMIDDIDRYCAAAEGIGMQGIVYSENSQLRTNLEQILSQS